MSISMRITPHSKAHAVALGGWLQFFCIRDYTVTLMLYTDACISIIHTYLNFIASINFWSHLYIHFAVWLLLTDG